MFQCSARLLAKELRDEAIRARLVRLVDPDTGSLSTQPERTADLLRQFDRTKYWLTQVKAGRYELEHGDDADDEGLDAESPRKPFERQRKGSASSNSGSQNSGRSREAVERQMPLEDLAIVKLINKKEAYDRQKAAKLEKKQGLRSPSIASSASSHKETELSWSSTQHDMEHKLKVILNHFKKKGPGAKGTVTIRAKQGKGSDGGMDREGKRDLVKRIEEFLCDWDVDGQDDGPTEPAFHARKMNEVEWLRGESRAVIHLEVVKGEKRRT